MSPSETRPPMLFCWGYDGVPGEFHGYINSLSEDGDTGEYKETGVTACAKQLRASLSERRKPFIVDKKKLPRLTPLEQNFIYMLHAYCAYHRQPAPPELLWLTFEALGLKVGEPALEFHKVIGIKLNTKIEDMEAFHTAALLDGKADAAGRSLPVLKLAKLIGVERETIRRWREEPAYKDRRKFVASVSGDNGT
ncbi:hypothetical protein [Bradyrhizobium elkanii]|uniref:Uncharacterized protein n=1 Tax=Bradyrhizobium elkanii TaxID=29448 RepID=A0A8I2C9I4_BRAEL|nr:hypothetical protein [Bradyrhizobium elkanii]MBP1297456.1 hypothetical protein [Bradyrhizobium elkanii]